MDDMFYGKTVSEMADVVLSDIHNLTAEDFDRVKRKLCEHIREIGRDDAVFSNMHEYAQRQIATYSETVISRLVQQYAEDNDECEEKIRESIADLLASQSWEGLPTRIMNKVAEKVAGDYFAT